LKVKNVAVTMM